MMTFDDIMYKLFEERSAFPSRQSHEGHGNALRRYPRWRDDQRYSVTFIGKRGISEHSMSWGSWDVHAKTLDENHVRHDAYIIAPHPWAAHMARQLDKWDFEKIGETMMDEDTREIVVIPEEALSYYPELEDDISAIGAKCVFDSRESELIFCWVVDSSTLTEPYMCPRPNDVWVIDGNVAYKEKLDEHDQATGELTVIDIDKACIELILSAGDQYTCEGVRYGSRA